jgi:hypothetical protein
MEATLIITDAATLKCAAATYSADLLGNAPSIRGLFEHSGQQWVCFSVAYGPGFTHALRVRLVEALTAAADWKDHEPANRGKRKGYTGLVVQFRRKDYIIGDRELELIHESEVATDPVDEPADADPIIPRRVLAHQSREYLQAQGTLEVPGMADAAREAHDTSTSLAAADVLRQAQPRIFDHTELCRRPLFAGTDADPQKGLFKK